jgi:1,4-dihydroxy-2-naphthoyl-CoA hydrolase
MTPFTQTLKVRMYDTDAAGILYFGNQFRFAHDTFEAMMDTQGWNFQRLFEVEPFIFVIVHAESDYLGAMHVGDEIQVTAHVSHIGNSSFTLDYEIHKQETLVGRAKTVHVCLDKVLRTKLPIPESFKPILLSYQA